MCQYEPFGRDINVKVDWSNYATIADLKNATGVDTPPFAKKVNLASLKSNTDELKTVSDNLNNLKSKVDKLDIDKLAHVPVDLRNLSNAVKNDVVKNDVYNVNIKNIENKIPDITNLATKNTLNATINKVKEEITSITNLSTTIAVTAVENKIPNVSNLVKKLTMTQKY